MTDPKQTSDDWARIADDERARRAIRRAVGGSVILLIVTALFGLVAVVPLSISLMIGHTRYAPGHAVYFSLCFLGFFVPAILYLLACLGLVRFKTWAAIVMVVVSMIHALCALVVAIGLLIASRTVGSVLVALSTPAFVLFAGAGATAYFAWQALRGMNFLRDTSSAFQPILKASADR